MSKLVAENLVKKFPRFTLKVDYLEFREGIHVIVGPNGSGKTVLIKLLSGALRPSRGRVTYISGSLQVKNSKILQYATIVTADLNLPNWRVEHLLEAYTGKSPTDIIEIAKEYRIREFLSKRYEDLSSGYKKRVQIAIALNTPADIIMLDEPFINVDTEYVSFLESKILNQKGKIIIVASHIPTKLLEHEIIALQDGVILFKGKIPSLLSKLVEIRSEGGNRSLVEVLEKCELRGEVRIKSLLEIIRENSNLNLSK
ncbi:MAG: ATP-binding cassette domain-containing protein [Desulfurococcales archaeon]|nr:ATP-binding cassette domain-containing protein [Desulfurococcales archaeon]